MDLESQVSLMFFLIASKVHCRANLTFVLRGAPCDFVRTSSVCTGKKTNSAEVGERAGTGVIHPVIGLCTLVQVSKAAAAAG